jgi:uncharacterized membrane protein YecN with MAPEG domain
MRQSIRHANIGIGVCTLVAIVGVLALNGSGEGALQLVGLAAFFSAFAVYWALEERSRRRKRRDGRSQ